MTKESPQKNSYGKIRDVCLITCLSPATVWRKVKDPNSKFPKPFKVGVNTTLWDLGEVVDWVESFKTARGI